MSDAVITKPDPRSESGSPDDRRPSFQKDLGNGAALGFTVGVAHWLFKCFQAGHFVMPDDGLLDFGAPTIIWPAARWIGVVLGLIGDIIVRKLRRDDT